MADADSTYHWVVSGCPPASTHRLVSPGFTICGQSWWLEIHTHPDWPWYGVYLFRGTNKTYWKEFRFRIHVNGTQAQAAFSTKAFPTSELCLGWHKAFQSLEFKDVTVDLYLYVSNFELKSAEGRPILRQGFDGRTLLWPGQVSNPELMQCNVALRQLSKDDQYQAIPDAHLNSFLARFTTIFGENVDARAAMGIQREDPKAFYECLLWMYNGWLYPDWLYPQDACPYRVVTSQSVSCCACTIPQ